MDMKALETLKLKLAEYSKENGTIAVHDSQSNNAASDCHGCYGSCEGTCNGGCTGTSYYSGPHYGGL